MCGRGRGGGSGGKRCPFGLRLCLADLGGGRAAGGGGWRWGRHAVGAAAENEEVEGSLEFGVRDGEEGVVAAEHWCCFCFCVLIFLAPRLFVLPEEGERRVVIGAGAGGAGAAVLSVGWVCVGLSERLRRAVCGCRVSDQPRWYWA